MRYHCAFSHWYPVHASERILPHPTFGVSPISTKPNLGNTHGVRHIMEPPSNGSDDEPTRAIQNASQLARPYAAFYLAWQLSGKTMI